MQIVLLKGFKGILMSYRKVSKEEFDFYCKKFNTDGDSIYNKFIDHKNKYLDLEGFEEVIQLSATEFAGISKKNFDLDCEFNKYCYYELVIKLSFEKTCSDFKSVFYDNYSFRARSIKSGIGYVYYFANNRFASYKSLHDVLNDKPFFDEKNTFNKVSDIIKFINKFEDNMEFV